MEHYIFHRKYTPKTRAEEILYTVEFLPKHPNMPKMSSTYATIHAAQDLIYALHNPEPSIPIVKLRNAHKEALRYLSEIFRKTTSPVLSSMVTVRGAYQEKLQQVNQEITQMKDAYQ